MMEFNKQFCMFHGASKGDFGKSPELLNMDFAGNKKDLKRLNVCFYFSAQKLY